MWVISLHTTPTHTRWPQLGPNRINRHKTIEARLAGPRMVRHCKKSRPRKERRPSERAFKRAPARHEILTLRTRSAYAPRQHQRRRGALVAIIPIPSIAVGIGPIPAQVGRGSVRHGSDHGDRNQRTQGDTRNDPAVVWPAYPWPRVPIGPSPPPVAWASTPVLSGDHRGFELR